MKQANYNTIREWIITFLIGMVMAVLMVSMVIGASIQHADRIEALAAVEVGE